MIKIKKIVLLTLKTLVSISVAVFLILFFYSAFFFTPNSIENKIVEDEKLSEIKNKRLKEEKKVILETQLQEKVNETEEKQVRKKIPIKTIIQDRLYATVGNKVITTSDIVNEIKTILILNNKSYSDEERQKLNQMAIKSLIKRRIKEIEIDKNNFLEFNSQDLKKELSRLAQNINVDLDTLKNICDSNDLDFSVIENQIKTDLLWNSLIFQLYKNRISINFNEIEAQLKLIQSKTKIVEYLISELVLKPVDKSILEATIKEVKDRINLKGFENVAINSSISDSATRGGELGWISENMISKKLISVISVTPVGSISEPILLPNGILIFKVRNKRDKENKIDLEETKNELVRIEKERSLNMHSSSHFSNLRRSVSIKFLNE